MKWVKKLQELGTDPGGSNGHSNSANMSERERNFRMNTIARCFVDPEKIDKDFDKMDKTPNLWANHPFEYLWDKEKYERFQKDYEIFCGGFLWFYDEEVKKGKQAPKNEDQENGKRNDEKKAVAKPDHFIYFEWSALEDGKGSVKIYLWPAPRKIPNSPPQQKGGAAKSLYDPLPPLPADEEAVDPPKPPPPPPPPML